MARCNLELMIQFACEELREKQARADLVIARDQDLARSVNDQIRQRRILIDNRRAQITQLRQQLPSPSVPGPVETDRDQRPKRPGVGDFVSDTAEELARQVRNRLEIRRLEREIEAFERRIQELLPEQTRRLDRLNESLAGKACIQRAMRQKRCVGA